MKNKLIYNSFNFDPYHTHMKLLSRIKEGSKILELGSASGYFTEQLIKKNCLVSSVEIDKDAVRQVNTKILPKPKVFDIEKIDYYLNDKEKYNYILCADIFEHLINPPEVLVKLKKYLKPNGRILISVPNIANFVIRLRLLFGNFEYKDYGILDKSHLHFFTKKTIENLLKENGYKIINSDIVAGFEVSKIYFLSLGRLVFQIPLLRKLEYYIAKTFPQLFALEFIYEAKIT